MEPRIVTADNAGLFTYDGSNTYLLGRERVALIDPGPDDPAHRARLADSLRAGGARRLAIVLTHDHADHAGGARSLASLMADEGLEVEMLASPRAEIDGTTPLGDADEIPTDSGRLTVIETPGHTRDHLALYWPGGRGLFAGDLILGEGNTAWVGSYPGCVSDYLESLRTIEALELRRVFPGHGPPVTDPPDAIERYREHRLKRIREVQEAFTTHAGASDEELVRQVYGEGLPERLAEGALWSVRAILHHLELRSFPR